MKRFRHILVVAAPGRLEAVALKAAARVSAASWARLTVLDVVSRFPSRRRAATIAGRTVDLEELLLQDHRERLRAAVDGAGITEAVVEARAGKPFIEVIRYAQANGCDLVIVGEQRRSRRRRSVDSEVMQLLRACPTPVWVMRPGLATHPRVLALVDPEPADPTRDSLNDRVIDLASSLAESESGELHVAHAWSLPGEATLRSSPYVALPHREVDAMERAAREEHQRLLDTLVERHGIPSGDRHTHLVKGEPGDALPRLADRLHIDLIVMGTVARTGLSGLVMGNTAETILRAVRCSVLAVKPEGFISPVSAEADDDGR